MQLKLTINKSRTIINKARTNATLEILEGERMYSNSVCVEKHHDTTIWDYKFNIKGQLVFREFKVCENNKAK